MSTSDPSSGGIASTPTSGIVLDFAAVASQAPVAWSVLDLDGNQVSGNEEYASLFGYGIEEIGSLGVADLTHPDDREATDVYLQRLVSGEIDRHEVDKRYVRKDGSEFVGHLVASLLRDDQGRPRALIGVISDVTENLRMAEALISTHDRAVELAEQRTHLVASVSHELRSPLHAILGLTELLAGTTLDEEQRGLVDAALIEATRLRNRVDDLLDFARIEADGVVIDPTTVDLRALVESVVRSVAGSEYAAGLEMITEVEPEVPAHVHVDGRRVDQILTNLITNAVKFTTDGSVRVGVAFQPGELHIAVVDTGPGIPEAHREAVFEPFVQVPGTPPELGGAGLGLALVRAVAGLMGGSVSLRSTTIGATADVRLPCEAVSVVPETTPSTSSSPAAAVRVLVVEDNEVNKLLVRRQLTKLGHDHQIVGRAEEALELLADADHGFDVVLMDWQLPDLDGLEATRRLREMERPDGRHVPVVAVTASAMPQDRSACKEAGMDDFLPKPVALVDLASTIARWATLSSASPSADVEIGGPGDDDFDPGRLDQLVDELNDRSVVCSLIERYLADLSARRSALHQGFHAGDAELLHRVAHTLRSTSEMLGAVALSDVCRTLEASGLDESTASVLELFDATAERAEDCLRGWVGASGAVT